MVNLSKIDDYILTRLKLNSFKDKSLNGLQVEGKSEIKKIASAVDASLLTVEEAIRTNSDLLLTHHGIFWGSPFAVSGSKKRLFKALLEADLSLYAVHLPLDAHPELGNNFCLAELLGLGETTQALEMDGQKIGCFGKATSSLKEMSDKLHGLQGQLTKPLVLPFGPKKPENVLIVSGSAANVLYEYRDLGFDTFITGEPRQFAYHFAIEENLNVIFAGHYATETLGVQALGAELADKFNLENTFIDIPTGI